MIRYIIISILLFAANITAHAQVSTAAISRDTSQKKKVDTTITLREVQNYVFKNPKDGWEYARDIDNIRVILPYLRIVKHTYTEVEEQKQADTKRQYHHYRKDLEKDMRDKFEKDVKDLTISQGKILFKLLGRETGHNAYHIIKECKNGFSAWTYQIVAKHYTYDLKQDYDPHREWILEMAIKYLGPEYNPD